MNSIYPDALDGYSQLPLFIDGVTTIDSANMNSIRSAIINIESELGIRPSGISDTVSERLSSADVTLSETDASIAALTLRVINIENTLNSLNPGNVPTVEKIVSDGQQITFNSNYALINIVGGGTVFLPSGSQHSKLEITIKDKGGAESNNILLKPAASTSDKIDGTSSILIDIDNASVSLIYDPEGQDWSII